MNENNEINNSTVKPYKATANLNTAIGNPSVNINDTMNINIQTMATNTKESIQTVQTNTNLTQTSNDTKPKSITEVDAYSVEQQNYSKIQPSSTAQNQTVVPPQNEVSTSHVQKTYVSTTNKKSKKKSITLNVGSEFRIVLLIIVILLVFVFLLPMISEMLGGY